MKGIGMNLAAVFYSDPKMFKELREASGDGLSRVEISYYPADRKQERRLFKEDFQEYAEVHLDLANAAFCKLEGVCHELPMKTLFEHFQEKAKTSQLFVQMPYTAALIYAANDKPGTYSGFFKDLAQTMTFNYQDFIAAHALPGPDSRIQCVRYPNGLSGGSVMIKLDK